MDKKSLGIDMAALARGAYIGSCLLMVVCGNAMTHISEEILCMAIFEETHVFL